MLCQAYQADNLSLMGRETLPGKGLIFSPWTAVIGIRMDGYPSSRSEQAQHLDVLRIHQLNQVVHDYVDTILMETAMVPEAEEIQLQALALHHPDVRNVAYTDLCEIGLSGYRAKGGELRAVEADPIVPAGMHVGKSFKYLRRIIHLVAGSVSKGFQPFFLSIHILEIKNLERVVMNSRS